MTTSNTAVPRERPPLVRLVTAGVGFAGLAVLGVFYFASGLVAPGWAVVLLIALWVGFVVLGVLWARRHPFRVLALPVVALGVLVAVVTLGERLLGWTA